MSGTVAADGGPRKPAANKNIKKLRTLSMVCSLARSWQQWVTEGQDKQASEPTGWAPTSLDDPWEVPRAPQEREGRPPRWSSERTSRPGQAPRSKQAQPDVGVDQGSKADVGESRIKTVHVMKTVTRDAQEKSAGIEFLTNRICQDPAQEELDKMLKRKSSPTRRRKCTNVVSALTRGWKAMEKEEQQAGDGGEESVVSEVEEEKSTEASKDTKTPTQAEDGGAEESFVSIKRYTGTGAKKEGQDASKLNTLSKKYSPVGNLKSRWQSWASEHAVSQKLNPFSEDFDYDYSMSTRLRKGEEGYGRPKEGSKTAERARRAEAHIHREIGDMCFVIRTMADPDPDGLTRITFGELFDRYVRISDKVVGILMRARKHGKVAFEGEMLWQGQDDGVVITLLV